MTRLTTPRADGALDQIFRSLGTGPSDQRLAEAAEQLHEMEARGIEIPEYEELAEIAESSGSSAIVALDLDVSIGFGIERLRAGPEAWR